MMDYNVASITHPTNLADAAVFASAAAAIAAAHAVIYSSNLSSTNPSAEACRTDRVKILLEKYIK